LYLFIFEVMRVVLSFEKSCRKGPRRGIQIANRKYFEKWRYVARETFEPNEKAGFFS